MSKPSKPESSAAAAKELKKFELDKFMDKFNVFSPELTVFSDIGKINYAYLKDSVKKLPVGSSVSLSAISPPPTTDLGGALRSQDLPVKFKWHTYTHDYFPDAKDVKDSKGNVIGVFDSKTEVLPAESMESAGGTFQLLSGNLISPDLSIIPFPSTELKDNKDESEVPSKLRAFVIQLEISIWAPEFERSSFTHNIGLVGVVSSWQSVLPEGPSIPAVPAGDAITDKGSIFRSLFQLAYDNLSPVPGKAVNLLMNPVDKTPTIPGQVTEILDQTPQIKIQAGVDVGAQIKGVATGVFKLFGRKPPPIFNSDAAVNVGSILNQIFSLPIAVNVNGLSKTKTIKPNGPVSIPIIDSKPGTSVLGGSLPFGSLNTLVKVDMQRENFSYVQPSWLDPKKKDLPAPFMLSNPIPGAPGISILPMPNLGPVGSDTSEMIQVDLSVPLSISLPGKPKPVVTVLKLLPLKIKIPSLPIPQIGLFFRQFLKDFGLPFGPPNEALQNRIMVAIDPATTRAFPGLEAVDMLQGLADVVDPILELFPRELIPADKTTAIATIANLNSIRDVVDTMIKFLKHPDAHPTLIASRTFIGSPKYGSLYSDVDLETLNPPWHQGYSDDPSTGHNDNISAIMWIGGSEYDPVNAFRMTPRLLGESRVNIPPRLWFPMPGSGVCALIWSANDEAPPGVGHNLGVDMGAFPIPNPPPPKILPAKRDDPDWNDEVVGMSWHKGNTISKD